MVAKEIVPPGFRELDETRGMVISDYQDELEKKWVTELRKKHNIELNKKVIKDVIKKLTN